MTELDLKLQDLKNAFNELKEENKRLKFSNSMLEKELQEYRQLDEQGLLLELPCKVGDVVYSVEYNRIKEFIVTQFDVFTENIYAISDSIFVGLMGYSVFATREEAEKALAKLSEVE